MIVHSLHVVMLFLKIGKRRFHALEYVIYFAIFKVIKVLAPEIADTAMFKILHSKV